MYIHKNLRPIFRNEKQLKKREWKELLAVVLANH